MRPDTSPPASSQTPRDVTDTSPSRHNAIRHASPRDKVVHETFSLKRAFMFGLALYATAVGSVALPPSGRNPVFRHAALPDLEGPRGPQQQSRGDPRYEGHLIPDAKPSFYKENVHPLLKGERVNITDFAHPNYFEAKNTLDLGEEIVVHRGLYDKHNGIPENSMGAIQKAYDAGFRSLEIDIQVTADGVPVLLHDFTLGRITGDPENRLVSHVNWDELKDKHLVIRNPVDGNFVETDQKVSTVRDALLDIATTKPDMSIQLDCKEQTAEDAFHLLLANPELRRFTALKLYAKAYFGGFDQFLGNLYARYGIDPQSDADRTKRVELLEAMKEIKVVPVFSEGIVQDARIHRFFPAQAPEGQLSAEGLAESAMAWIQGWRTMDIKVIEARSYGPETLDGRAMMLLNQGLAEPGSGVSRIATSAAYRFEDFSVPQSDGSKKFFTWQIFGGIRDVTDDPASARTETAGAFRHAGYNVLTDQPVEEAYAAANDRTLARGHTGVELDVTPGTQIDTARNMEIVQQRGREFLAEKQQPDADLIASVRAGRLRDAAAPPSAELASFRIWSPAAAAVVGAGVFAYGYRKGAYGAIRTAVAQAAWGDADSPTSMVPRLVVDTAQRGLVVVRQGVNLMQQGIHALQRQARTTTDEHELMVITVQDGETA
ncbi:MAG TPA: glycerophosphodiester phosphodiesterase family protein [Albitalea sp.]|uniref:glycerophosphodiester phosphodiesterase family protein n=1 Tax=Piscinibacter sp. TaxID=1903157 RepID=UPI002ED3C3FE